MANSGRRTAVYLCSNILRGKLDLGKFKKLMQPTPDPELFKGLGSLFKSKTKGKI